MHEGQEIGQRVAETSSPVRILSYTYTSRHWRMRFHPLLSRARAFGWNKREEGRIGQFLQGKKKGEKERTGSPALGMGFGRRRK